MKDNKYGFAPIYLKMVAMYPVGNITNMEKGSHHPRLELKNTCRCHSIHMIVEL